LPTLIPGSPPRQTVWILFDQSLNQAVVAKGDCRKDVVPRAARHQEIHNGLVPFPCRPPNHVPLMQVAGPMDVGASVQKKTNTLYVPMRGCEMQRAGVVALVANIRIRTVLEQ
jgi:hypothetical protein